MAQETEVTKTVERTPGPLRLSLVRDDESQDIWSEADMSHYVARCVGPNASANAQFIVTACNAYGPMREALILAEKADRIHSKCQECEDGAQAPEACEHCFPSADDARVARRNILKSLGVRMRDVDRAGIGRNEQPACDCSNEDVHDCGLMRDALLVAERNSEEIRKVLVNNLSEPERSAFWLAVSARDQARAALSTLPSDDARSDEIGRLREAHAVLLKAAQAVINMKFDQYTKRNGHKASIEAEDGEKCWIVHSDQIAQLEGAITGASEGICTTGVLGWIVGNGDGTKWRYWGAFGPEWTPDRNMATRYARREDAEAVHANDEDAWTIHPYTDKARAALIGVPQPATSEADHA